MQVETYEIEEIAQSEASTMAADSEACELIAKLGLTGQAKITNAETVTRNKYRRMTALEQAVFEIIMPEKTRLKKFDSGCIPLRVLRVIDEATQSGLFVRFDVWHQANGQRDPILVGITGKLDPQTWDSEYVSSQQEWLLARWDDALEPFQALVEKAKKIQTVKIRRSLNEKLQAVEFAKKNMDDGIDEMFLTGKAPSFLSP